MSNSITLQLAAKRIYFAGNTFPIKDKIKALGGHWDGDRKMWWVGSAKAAEANALIAELAGSAASPASTDKPKVSDDSKVVGKATYKGRSYYVLWMGRCNSGAEKAHLTVLDGSIDFWADLAACEITKRYSPREYRGRTEYTTIGGLRRFIEKARRVEASGEAMPMAGCQECRNLGHMCDRCRFDEFDN